MWGTRFGMARALLKYANLGPGMHPYALQCSNWICNRLPQISRAFLSAWFILARRLASVGYLKSFGCLVRLTIPHARREGDHHFADRGVLGIYLGPSEQSPGCVVYVPSSRKFFVSRDIIAYEDVHPGVRHVDSTWPQVDEPTPLYSSSVSSDTATPMIPTGPPLRESTEAVPTSHMEVDDSVPPSDQFENVTGVPSATITPDEPTTDPPALPQVASSNLQVPTVQRGESDTLGQQPVMDIPAQYDPTRDPRSRSYKRVLPERSTRYSGAYSCFVDPTSANREQAILNLYGLMGDDVSTRGDLVAYASSTSTGHFVYIVTTTYL